MRRIQLRVYSTALHALPADFRGRYSGEMQALFEEQLESAEGLINSCCFTVAEASNVLIIALRMRFSRYPLQAPALITLAIVLAFVRAPSAYTPVVATAAAMDSVDFVASDPAGEFTLHVRHGRAVSATVDRHRLGRRHLVQAGDSIRVLNPTGRVLFAVAYNRDTATIEWEARPAACRGRALHCGVEQ